ncbi:MAG: HAD family hydrolase [Alphaproteobacteria bacterium]|nr:HAD family hydrolase [Alphaproteobacteria bacterium]
MTMPRAVIFDWDNTLADTRPVITEALNGVRTAFGLPVWTMDEAREHSARSLRESFPEWFGDKWPRAREIYYEYIHKLHIKRLKPMPGADDLVRWLHGAGVPLFVASNKKGDILRKEVAAMNWQDLFTGVVGSLDAPRDKPARDQVDLALSYGKLEAGKDVWLVGDAGIDVLLARNSGCMPVFIGNNEEGIALKVDMVFSDCKSLHDLLYNLHNNKTSEKGRHV